jgi:hypothetical protein
LELFASDVEFSGMNLKNRLILGFPMLRGVPERPRAFRMGLVWSYPDVAQLMALQPCQGPALAAKRQALVQPGENADRTARIGAGDVGAISHTMSFRDAFSEIHSGS